MNSEQKKEGYALAA